MYTEEIEDDFVDDEVASPPLHNQEHRRSTFTYEESRLIKFVRYTKFSSVCWLVYLIPATIALVFAMFYDTTFSDSCNKYLFTWAFCQTILQICNITTKVSTLFVLSRLPSPPEPEDIEYVTLS